MQEPVIHKDFKNILAYNAILTKNFGSLRNSIFSKILQRTSAFILCAQTRFKHVIVKATSSKKYWSYPKNASKE